MRYTFEIYLTADELTAGHWQRLHTALVKQAGRFEAYEIIISCLDNRVRYLLSCNKNVGALASGTGGMLLRPVAPGQAALPAVQRREGHVKLEHDSTLLRLKERYRIKKGKELGYARLRVYPFGHFATMTDIELYFQGASGQWSKAHKSMALLPSGLLQADFGGHGRYVKQSLPRYLGVAKALPLLSENDVGAVLRVDPFPLLTGDRYIHLDSYDFDKHSLIVGASGSGKSKLISLIINRLNAMAVRQDYRIVVIDPHASLAADFVGITDRRVVTFGAEDGAELFPGAETDLSSAVELTATLFRSILADQFNPRLDRLLRYSLFSLMTAQTMSIGNLKRFLADTEYRGNIMRHVGPYVPENVYKFFGTDFNELRSQYYETTIMPLVTLVDEMQLQPSMSGHSETSLAQIVQTNFLTVFSLNRISMGDKTLKTVAGLLVQQLFLLAQSRQFNQRVILVIDEVSVVQNPALAQILAEARKFNLTIILTQQYFGQIDKDLRDAIFSNIYNYYMFKVSEEDALSLEGNVGMDLPKELINSEREKGVTQSQLKATIMAELSPRECLVRLMSDGKLLPCVLARTMEMAMTAAQEQVTENPTRPRLPAKYTETEQVNDQQTLQAAHVKNTIQPQGHGHILSNLLRRHSSSRLNIRKEE